MYDDTTQCVVHKATLRVEYTGIPKVLEQKVQGCIALLHVSLCRCNVANHSCMTRVSCARRLRIWRNVCLLMLQRRSHVCYGVP